MSGITQARKKNDEPKMWGTGTEHSNNGKDYRGVSVCWESKHSGGLNGDVGGNDAERSDNGAEGVWGVGGLGVEDIKEQSDLSTCQRQHD